MKKKMPRFTKTDIGSDGDTNEYQLYIYLKTKDEKLARERANFIVDQWNKLEKRGFLK